MPTGIYKRTKEHKIKIKLGRIKYLKDHPELIEQLKVNVKNSKKWIDGMKKRNNNSDIEVKPQFKIDKNLDNTQNKLKAVEEFAKNNNYNFSVWTEKELNL